MPNPEFVGVWWESFHGELAVGLGDSDMPMGSNENPKATGCDLRWELHHKFRTGRPTRDRKGLDLLRFNCNGARLAENRRIKNQCARIVVGNLKFETGLNRRDVWKWD